VQYSRTVFHQGCKPIQSSELQFFTLESASMSLGVSSIVLKAELAADIDLKISGRIDSTKRNSASDILDAAGVN